MQGNPEGCEMHRCYCYSTITFITNFLACLDEKKIKTILQKKKRKDSNNVKRRTKHKRIQIDRKNL